MKRALGWAIVWVARAILWILLALVAPQIWLLGFLVEFMRTLEWMLRVDAREHEGEPSVPFTTEHHIDTLSDTEMHLLNRHEQTLREGRNLWH